MSLTRCMSMVQQFHELNGWPIRTEVSSSDGMKEDMVAIGARLQDLSVFARESAELFVPHFPNDVRMWAIHMQIEELAERVSAMADEDEISIADGLGDELYVLLGAFMRYNLPAEEIFEEIHRSNMTKKYVQEPSSIQRSRNKGPNFSPPDLKKAIAVGRERQVFHERWLKQQYVMGIDSGHPDGDWSNTYKDNDGVTRSHE